MKYYSVWAIPLLFSMGCSSASSTQTATTSAFTPQTKKQVVLAKESVSHQQTPDIQQDYAATAPLPATGKVTIRDSIRNLDMNQLIADCPSDSAPYAFAESTNYRVQICSEEYDPWQPKYYIGQAKDGSGEMHITSSNPDEARQLIFKHDGYTYILYRDSARPELTNAYLEVYSPSGENHAEALMYLYEASNPPR